MHLLPVLYYVCVGFFWSMWVGNFPFVPWTPIGARIKTWHHSYGFTFVPFVLTLTVQSAWDRCDVMPCCDRLSGASPIRECDHKILTSTEKFLRANS